MTTKTPLKDGLMARWQALAPQQRSQLMKAGIVAALLAVLGAGYYLTDQDKKKPPPAQHVSLINVGDQRLQDDLRAQVERERQEQRNRNDQQEKELQDTQKQIQATQAQLSTIASALQQLNGATDGAAATKSAPVPEWPAQWQQGGTAPAGKTTALTQPDLPPAEPQMIGDIGALKIERPAADSKKKANHKYFLPVSFMPAKLLTGLKAKTVENASKSPEPMLLRVQAPAVLPNEVRAQLKGCFVVANGFGSLSSERVEAQLVSLSCVDYDDHEAIEADIKGIVVDKDGVKGLAGHPVSKAGANMARAALAAAFQGAGQALAQSGTTTSTSALGSTQTLNTNEIGKAALGQGLAGGASEMAKVYLELVRQSAPVIEVGPSKDVAVLITEGVWLEIKSYETN